MRLNLYTSSIFKFFFIFLFSLLSSSRFHPSLCFSHPSPPSNKCGSNDSDSKDDDNDIGSGRQQPKQ